MNQFAGWAGAAAPGEAWSACAAVAWTTAGPGSVSSFVDAHPQASCLIGGIIVALVAAIAVLIACNLRRKRDAAKLMANEARFRELVENIGEGVWVLDAGDLRALYVSAAYAQILAQDAAVVKGPGAASGAVHPDDLERVKRAYAQVGSAGRLDEEYRIVRRDGEVRWVRDRGRAVYSAQGVPLRVIGHTSDVTERRAMEDALRESQRAMSTLMSNLPGMAYRCLNDRNWTMEFVSEGCAELTGYAARDVEFNRRVAYNDLIHPDDRDQVWDNVQKQVVKHAPFELTYRIATATGDSKWVWEMGRGVFSDAGELLALEGFIADDSQRRRAVQALRESEERYRNLVEGAPIPILIHSEEKFVFANPAALKALGAARNSDLVGRSIWDFVHPDERARVRERVRLIYEEGKAAPVIEERFVRLDGGVIDVEVTGSAVDFSGKIASQVVFTDITQRKRVEAERIKLEGQLRQSQKMEAVGQLAGGVAHDFNNILTAIIGHLGLTRDTLARTLPADHPGMNGLNEIDRAANRAAALTRQLLTFSRKDVAKPEILSLNVILDEMSGMLRRLIHENIALSIKLDPRLHAVRADASQIEQVVLNLVVNARDAMPDGGTLDLETRNVTFDEAYLATHPEAHVGLYVMLSVSDSGQGMDDATKERIFEPFFTTKDVGQGSGLGLATVHGIVRQSGGHVTVYSEPGVGSTFRVCFPAAEGDVDPERAVQTGAEDAVGTGAETVLVCEDDETVRQLTTQILTSAGYQVLSAERGPVALRIARRHQGIIHLLVTDVIMPEMNGREIARTLSAERPEMRILFISGYTSDVIAHHGVVDSGIEFLEKPFTRTALLKRVREVLDGDHTGPVA